MKCLRCGAALERYIERASGPGVVIKVRHACPSPLSRASIN